MFLTSTIPFLCIKNLRMAEEKIKGIQERLYQSHVELSISHATVQVMHEELIEINELLNHFKSNQKKHDTSK